MISELTILDLEEIKTELKIYQVRLAIDYPEVVRTLEKSINSCDEAIKELKVKV